MDILLEKTSWEITDDVAWTKAWVGLSRGDIFRGEVPYGWYVAAWYPNTNDAMVMIVTVVNELVKPVLSIGVKCLPGKLETLCSAEPEEIPWTSDGAVFADVVRPAEYAIYARASEALGYARDIILLDDSLRKYICEPGMILTLIKPSEVDDD